MKLLNRYLATTVITATGLVSLIILATLSIIMLLGELKNMGEGDYGLFHAIFYVILRLPSEFYQFSPIILLLGSMIGLSLLSSHRELPIMQISGFSSKQILKSVLSAALFLILILFLIGELIGPSLSYKAEIQRENAQNAGQAVVTAAGVWFHIDNNFIHVKQLIGRKRLEHVTRYQFDDKHRLQVAYYAQSLTHEHHQWLMKNGVKTVFYPDRTKSTSFSEEPWDLTFNANLLNIGLVDPHDMSLPKLLKFSRYLDQNGLESTEYEYPFWQRVFQPLVSLVMIFLAIPFVIGTLSTLTLSRRILIGIALGFAFFILNAFLGQLCIVYQFKAPIAASLPLFLFFLLGLVLHHRFIKL